MCLFILVVLTLIYANHVQAMDWFFCLTAWQLPFNWIPIRPRILTSVFLNYTLCTSVRLYCVEFCVTALPEDLISFYP